MHGRSGEAACRTQSRRNGVCIPLADGILRRRDDGGSCFRGSGQGAAGQLVGYVDNVSDPIRMAKLEGSEGQMAIGIEEASDRGNSNMVAIDPPNLSTTWVVQKVEERPRFDRETSPPKKTPSRGGSRGDSRFRNIRGSAKSDNPEAPEPISSSAVLGHA